MRSNASAHHVGTVASAIPPGADHRLEQAGVGVGGARVVVVHVREVDVEDAQTDCARARLGRLREPDASVRVLGARHAARRRGAGAHELRGARDAEVVATRQAHCHQQLVYVRGRIGLTRKN